MCLVSTHRISKYTPIAPGLGVCFLFNEGKLNILNKNLICYNPAGSAAVTIIPHGHAGILSQPSCCARRASPTMCTGHAAADFLRAKHHLTGIAGCQATRWLISFSQRILNDASALRCGRKIGQNAQKSNSEGIGSRQFENIF